MNNDALLKVLSKDIMVLSGVKKLLKAGAGFDVVRKPILVATNSLYSILKQNEAGTDADNSGKGVQHDTTD